MLTRSTAGVVDAIAGPVPSGSNPGRQTAARTDNEWGWSCPRCGKLFDLVAEGLLTLRDQRRFAGQPRESFDIVGCHRLPAGSHRVLAMDWRVNTDRLRLGKPAACDVYTKRPCVPSVTAAAQPYSMQKVKPKNRVLRFLQNTFAEPASGRVAADSSPAESSLPAAVVPRGMAPGETTRQAAS